MSHPDRNVQDIPDPTAEYVLSQTMLRIRDPEVSIPFYRDVLGMALLARFDFGEMKFSLYFMGYAAERGVVCGVRDKETIASVFRRTGCLELTHNWGTESDPLFAGHHNGNENPKGFGHIGITVPDVDQACARFHDLGVRFVKKPGDGRMKGLAFIADPDGYWIEILSAPTLAELIVSLEAAT